MGQRPDERDTEMTTRQTAAARVVSDEYSIPGLIADLANADEARLTAQRSYDTSKRDLEEVRLGITDAVIAEAYKTSPKVTQAEIDRNVKAGLRASDGYRSIENETHKAKQVLDEASSAYEVARIHHRTVVTQLNAASSALRFLAASKTARAVALAQLADL